MKLALVLGSKSSTIKPKLQSIKDNLDIDCFDNIPMFIDFALKRSSVYDRILCLSSNSSESMLRDLHSYWSNYSRNTSIVFLCKKGTDEAVADNFVRMFTSPIVSSMLVENTTVQILSEAVLCSNEEINNQYGIKDFIGLGSDEGVELNLAPKEEPKPVEVEPVVEEAPQEVQSQEPKQKRSLVGSLFGGKKNKGGNNAKTSQQNTQPAQQQNAQVAQSQQTSQQPQQMAQQSGQMQQQVNQMQQQPQQMAQQPQQMPQQSSQMQQQSQQIPQPQDVQQDVQMNQQQIPQMVQVPQNDINFEQTSSSVQTMQNGQVQQNIQSNAPTEAKSRLPKFPQRRDKKRKELQQNSQIAEPVNNIEQSEYQDEAFVDNSSYQDETFVNDEGTQFNNESDFSMNTSSFETDNDFYGEQNSNFESNDSFESEDYSSEEVTEDVNISSHGSNIENRYARKDSTSSGNTDINSVSPSPLVTSNVDSGFAVASNVVDDFAPDTEISDSSFASHRSMTVDQDEVDEDLGGVNLSSAEDTYRKQNEQPKVVVKEVIRTVGGGDGTIKSILSGKNPTVIVVTGDRGTGVTSTAMKLSEFFASKTKVLYFDCDVENHGVLSYINYDGFRDYEMTKMNGVKLCKSLKVFDNCVCTFESNFDILTTDYTCDVTDEEIATAASVVAEKVTDYGVVIVDCPVKKLHSIYDLVLQGITIVCVEGTKRGMMNMLCQFENSPLQLKYKKMIVNKGSMFITKLSAKTDFKKLLKYVGSIYEPDGVNWLAMRNIPFNGNVDIKMMSAVIMK